MHAEAPVRSHDHAVTRKLQWLALSLTPGVGAGRGRKLVEMYGGIDRLFTASLTELEGAGLPGAAAQSIAWVNRWNWRPSNMTMPGNWALWSSFPAMPNFPGDSSKYMIRRSRFTLKEVQKS